MANDKFRPQRYRFITRNLRKREKFLQPLIRDDEGTAKETERFFSIVKNEPKTGDKSEEQKRYFISPMRGRVPDKSTFPINRSRMSISKQYDFIRPKDQQKEPDFRNNYREFYIYRPSEQRKPSVVQEESKQQADVLDNNHSEQKDNSRYRPFVFTEYVTIEEKETPPQSSASNAEALKDSASHPVITRPQPTVKVLYEEEIELHPNRSVITSYDESNNQYFFGDFEKYHGHQIYKKQEKKTQSNLHVTDYSKHDEKILREIRQIFSDVHVTHSENNERETDPVPLNSPVRALEIGKSKERMYYEEELTIPKLETVRIQVPKRETEVQTPQSQSARTTSVQTDPKFQDLKRELEQALNDIVEESEDEEKQDQTNRPLPYEEEDYTNYQFPPIELLNPRSRFQSDQTVWAQEQMQVLDETLQSFGISAQIVGYTIGPSVTRFEIEPEPGTKVSRITSLADDLQLRLAAKDIFVKAPIAGKSTVGIEIPNPETRTVNLREILESPIYQQAKSPLKIALGLDIAGEPIFSDISTMTHTLIAGSTGSGKSVCINSIIISILYNALPSDVKLVLIDPKKVEFAQYRDIPHLLTPVINDPKAATATLKWLTEEMDRRYELIESVGARDIRSYNIKRSRNLDELPKLPYIVVIIDELADLMMVSMSEVEEYIQRIAQLARAAGIHLIVATQRPSANVITGTIKTNIPSRIAFKVASQVDSRIILDTVGAEKLIGKGDMLFVENGKAHMIRLQGAYVSEEEIERITDFCRMQAKPNYQFYSDDLVKQNENMVIEYEDELFDDAVRLVIELGEASASRLQRHFKIGYNRAARMIDMMEQMNIISPHTGGSKPREVLMTLEEYEKMFRNIQ